MKLNKLISAAAAALIAFSAMLPVLACAEEANTVEDELTDGTFTYELIDGSYTITDCASTAIITSIPDLRNGYAVTAIADEAFVGCTYISELSIPKTIKSIGKYAFAGCSSMTKITLPSSIDEIPDGAFAGCASLTEVTIPDGVESIGIRAFYNCSALEKVEFSDTVASVGDYAFQYCYMLNEINLTQGISKIGKMAFGQCATLDTITADGSDHFTVEDGILYSKDKTKIYRASVGLEGKLTIPEGVSSIEGGAFSYCSSITSVILPNSLIEIGDYAFDFCTALSDIDFPSTGVSSIGAFAFEHCTALTSLSLPTTLTTIGEAAFFDCTALERVIMTESVSEIGTCAFLQCSSLKNVIVPKSAGSVGDYAFGFSVNDDGTEYVANDDFSISVYSGSAGEKYAKSNDINFTVVDRSLKKLAFIIVSVGVILAAVVFAVVLMRKGRKSAPLSVKKAEKQAEEENYETILGKDDEE